MIKGKRDYQPKLTTTHPASRRDSNTERSGASHPCSKL